MAQRDWVEWHRDYDDPGSLLSRRGELVQGHLRAELERAPAGDVRLVSLCAGQGRDVIGVLTGHPRRHDVRARLVELDERNVALARQAAQAAGLHGVEVLQADAGLTDACGITAGGAVVVRPDGFIAWRRTLDSANPQADLEHALRRILDRPAAG